MTQKEREEIKRRRVTGDRAAWRQYQEFVAWLEEQMPPEKRRNRPRWPRWLPRQPRPRG